MITSYHNHTLWSDGTTEVAAMLAAAVEARLTEVGISDHFVLTPGRQAVEWSMPVERVGEYVRAVRAAECPVAVRLGVEADYFPENEAQVREALAPYPWDYVIGSVHFVDGFAVDSAPEPWEALSPSERDDVFRGYWARVEGLARSGNYDFVGHLDLPKKFGFAPQVDLGDAIARALDAIAAAGMAIEINTAGALKPCREFYPSRGLLAECHRRGIPLLINADAHAPEHLAWEFDAARRLAWEVGYRSLVRYERRRPIPYPLAP